MKEPLCIQISIPFCFKQCSYCSYPYCQYDPAVIRSYLKALAREIESTALDEELDLKNRFEVKAVSIDGGSPALTGPEGLSEILRSLRRHFEMSEDVQIGLQTMPGDYSRALMEKMRDMGVNFWTIGLETAQREEHELLQRPYKFDAITMVDMAIRTFQPRLLDFHLLYGIPGQTLHSFRQTLKRTLFYQPEHITLSPLRLEPGVVLTARCEAGETAFPTDEQRSELLQAAKELLEDAGFSMYYPGHFALPGRENQYLLLTLKGTARLGLGYHSVTALDGYTWTTGHSLQEYLEHSDDYTKTANQVREIL